MKKLLLLSIAFLTLQSCDKEKGCTDPLATNYDALAEVNDGTCVYTSNIKQGFIESDETWETGNTYYLEGRVVVTDGATLTIEPGVIVKGKLGTETNASALVISKGSKIYANGTSANPIIFTSELDNIEIGQSSGTNLTRTDNEKWGGLVILGNAPVSTENGDTQGNIEGIPANNGYGSYGGFDSQDNSGSLTYVSIRHGGVTIGEGNELNGLTLGSVGSGTVIENIEIYATLDDGVEFFGGTVNVTNLLVYFQGDDGIDIDQNYSGTVTNFAVYQGDGIGTDEGLEIDGPEGSTNINGKFSLINGICKTVGSDGSAADLKSKAQGDITNVTFDYPVSVIKIRSSYESDCVITKNDAYSNLISGELNITNCLFSSVEVYSPSCAVPQVDQTNAENIVSVGNGSGVDMNVFSWTNAYNKNQL